MHIPLLPKWHLHTNRPCFYDEDAGTMLELASVLHGKMNILIEDYNKFVDGVNKTVADFISGEIESREAFEVAIRQEFQDFIDVIDLKISSQDAEIEELKDYVKNNLETEINSFLTQMKESGELDETIMDSISAMGNVIQGIRRKINCHTNTIRNLYIYRYRDKCEFTGPSSDGKSMKLTCSTGNEQRSVAILIDSDGADKFEIAFLSNFRIKNLFTTGTADKTLLGVWVDGQYYDSFDEVRALLCKFNTLVVAYSVACEGYTINVCYTINAYGITVHESVPEGTEGKLLTDTIRTTSTTTFFPVFTATTDHAVFGISEGNKNKIYIESVVDMGSYVMKKIDFNGGL